MCSSFAERADWVADAVSVQYGFMLVVAVGMGWDFEREGVFGVFVLMVSASAAF